MRKGTRTIFRKCKCGCGKDVRPYIGPTSGRVEGYPKFIPGHGHKVRGATVAKLWKDHPELHPSWMPIGSRRKHGTGRGIYWVVKVEEGEKWKYEHREIMEKKIGRRLKKYEHVHHKNKNTLDNSESNLLILSNSHHQMIHQSLDIGQWSRKYVSCIECGTSERRHLCLGLCVACYQKQRRVKEYQKNWHATNRSKN